MKAGWFEQAVCALAGLVLKGECAGKAFVERDHTVKVSSEGRMHLEGEFRLENAWGRFV